MGNTSDTVMKPGDTIICRGSRGYFFTEGKEYTVIEFEAAGKTNPEDPYTWPAYVVVLDDYGDRAHCHASRFIIKG